MIDEKEKMAFLKKSNKETHRVYLPNPGISVKTNLEVGDMVLIDIAYGLGPTLKNSLNLDMSSEYSRMLALNGKWIEISRTVNRKEDSIYSYYKLKDTDFVWHWYHFGAVLKKDFIKKKEISLLPDI